MRQTVGVALYYWFMWWLVIEETGDMDSGVNPWTWNNRFEDLLLELSTGLFRPDAASLLSHQLWRTHTDHTSAMAGVIWFHVKLFVLLHPSHSTNDAVLRSFWNLEKTISRFQFRSFCVISVISSLSRKIPMYFFIPRCLVLCSLTLRPTYFLHLLVLRWLNALVDTDTTPRIQLINRSNFATDAIFLSSPPCRLGTVHPPRFQTLLRSRLCPLPLFPQQFICPPACVTVLSHEDPSVVPAGAARVSLHPRTRRLPGRVRGLRSAPAAAANLQQHGECELLIVSSF